MICLAARFQDSELARQQLEALIAQTTYNNLFDTHPRNAGNTSCFQIDGNMSAVAGVSKMLMQSHDGFIELLPAKPANWQTGHIKGLIAKGGFKVDVIWKLGTLKSVRIESLLGGKCTLKFKDKTTDLETRKDEVFTFNADLKLVVSGARCNNDVMPGKQIHLASAMERTMSATGYSFCPAPI
jgi:alpha-L-fucosidase 2